MQTVRYFYAGETFIGKRSCTDEEAAAIIARHEWTEGSEPPPPPIERRRISASLTRAAFLKACVAGRIITPAVAEEAATGQWPAAFDTFLSGLTSDQRIDAKATWADGGDVHRTNTILALIAADQGVSDEALDAMFGLE